ncbi:MAG: hypothetical protein IT460_12610 [Planctomycetes bacterium]|nr:hypothetical protein [Planctomycetota bacterium]
MRQVEAGQRGWPPTCDACGARIESRPERFGAVGFLTSDPESPAFAFSGICAHRGCLPRWPRRAALREALARLRDDTRVVATDGARPARGPLDASIDELDAVARGVPADRPLAWLEVGVWAVAVVGLGLFTLLVVLFALASRAIGEM